MVHPFWLEIALLAILLCISGALFWHRFRKPLDVIRRSRDNPDFKLRPLAPRIRQFVWEVMLQGKVIRERPLPGIAHAFVFWGFCAFALVTLNHLAAGFGLPFVSRASAFGKAYLVLAAMFAVAVAVSIAGLAIRRFVTRPRWLGKVAPESGIIALLIFLLMATYLAGLAMDETTTVARVNWWLHTLTLLAFLPLIPHTKHLHLIISPATVFLRRAGFSKIPPLVGDEDFGLDTGKDVTKLDALQAYSCVECGRCTEHCPAYNTGKELNPKEIILGLRRYLNEEGPGNEEPLLGKHISMEAAFQCTTCGACEFQCPVGIQHLPVIIGLRRGAVNTGKWEDDYGGKMFLAMERNGNSLGFASSERLKFIEKNELPIFDGTQEYCLWLGCMGSYDPQGREIVLSLVQVLRHLGVTFGVLRKEKCTGDPVRRLGNDLLFSQMAESNIEQMKSAKVTKLLSICPHCVRTIGEDWKEFGATFQIEHHSELLARMQEKLPQRTEGREKVVFHDPCYLGRYRNIYEEPREVIARTGDVVDPGRTRERSFCCGAGGGQMFLGEEKGKRVNVERATELAATGAAVVGTACPFCQTMFRDALGSLSQTPPKLLDIAQIAAASIASETAQRML
jgi:Fe-S oxidoreductase